VPTSFCHILSDRTDTVPYFHGKTGFEVKPSITKLPLRNASD
jgi:hypothetical protein